MTVGFLDDARTSRVRKGPPCSFVSIFTTLAATGEADELQAAFDDDMVATTAITRVLNERGIRVGYETVKRHRRGDCSCDQWGWQ